MNMRLDAMRFQAKRYQQSISVAALRRCFPGAIRKVNLIFELDGINEFTIEVNPDDVSPAKVDTWIGCGINRVSIGVQSLDDNELKTVGRRHNARQALDAIALIQRKGITNISGDLIYGLPGQDMESFGRSLSALIDTGITHLSAYCLSFEEGTRLWRWLEQGRVSQADDSLIEDMYTLLCRQCSAAGFEHYEISNFAKPGFARDTTHHIGAKYLISGSAPERIL